MTTIHWMEMFSEWAKERLSAPQNDEAQAVIVQVMGGKGVISQATCNYWLQVFSDWAEVQLTPSQNDEAQVVITQYRLYSKKSEFCHQALCLVDQAVSEITAILRDMWRDTDRAADVSQAEGLLADCLLRATQNWCDETVIGNTSHYSDNYFDLAS